MGYVRLFVDITSFKETIRMKKKISFQHLFRLLPLIFIVAGAAGSPPGVMAATDEEVADAVSAGQQYLSDTFVDLENGTGYWPDYTNLAGTCAAVAALIETGKGDDPAYFDKIQKGVEYIKQFVQENGSIHSGHQMYETGMALVALSLFDQDHAQEPEYELMIQNAVDFLKSAQNLYDSAQYGGWYYYHESRNGDLSNTQFAVMGLWYASRYLKLPVQGTEWADALLVFLENTQSFHDGTADEGAFSYFPDTYDFTGGSMTGAGLWCLAMIGQSNNPMVAKAVDWFDRNYSWDRNAGSYYNDSPDNAYYYSVYGMAKGLTATVGPDGAVGERNWSQDLKDRMVAHQDPAGYWYRGGWLDPGKVICTSWVLMSLAFADPSTGSSEVFLPDRADATYPIRGLVILQVGGGATISNAQRLNIDPADNIEGKNFPLGGFYFLLDTAGASSTIVHLTPPVELFNQNNPYGFVHPDGTTKEDIEWFFGSNPWAASGALVEIDREAQVIRITLEDGGTGDTDGENNGKITGPGAPVSNMPSSQADFKSPAQDGGSSQGHYRMASIPLNGVAGNTLAKAIDSGVPSGWTYGAQGDIRIFLWNTETRDYEELFGDAVSVLAAKATHDMAGLAFWRIALETTTYNYTGTPLDPATLPIDPGTGSPYFQIALKQGWNQFGFPFHDITKIRVHDLLISDDGVNFIRVTDSGNTVSQQTVWEYEDTNGDGNVNDVQEDNTDYDAAAYINQGYGYWLYVNDIAGASTQAGAALRILHQPVNGKTISSLSSMTSTGDETPPPDPPSGVTARVSSSGSAGTAACFIATAAYGSALDPHVEVLRQFRDIYLLTHEPGRKLVDLYYRLSPKPAEIIAVHPVLKSLTRAVLLPAVGYGTFMVHTGPAAKLSVMLALVLTAACLVRRRRLLRR